MVNPGVTFDVEDVLSRLTIAEKAALTIGLGAWAVAPLPEHGVRGLSLADGPHGVRKVRTEGDPRGRGTAPATCFPTASLLGSTWDREVVRRVGQALGREARAAGVDVLLGPGVNIKRSPLCGRNFEYFSEDPLLSGVAGAAWIEGVQSAGVDACVKHFAVNNQEHRRFSVDAIVDERALREIYLPAFRAAVGAQVATVMSAYNRVNGTYATESPTLLTRVLREEWGFDGAVISDWGAVNDRVASLAAGMDLQMPGDGADRVAETVDAVEGGRLDEADLDRAARAVLRLIQRAEERRADPVEPFDEDAHHHLGRLTASAGTVLLRNEPVDGAPVLPFAPRLQAPYRIALIGALAGEPRFQGSGSSRVVPTRVATLRSELRKRLPFSQIHYVPGYRRHDDVDSPPLRQVAVREAAEADVAVVVVGLPESHETEGLDRTAMDLPAPHDALVRAVAATNPRTVVVVVSGAPVTLPWRDEVPAILQAYLGGQAAGAALADVLTGATDPGGRLAETFPAALGDHPVAAIPNGPRQAEYRESLFVGYRWFDTADVPVAFPFGHGLSYTTFEWTDSSLSAADVTPAELTDGRLEVSVTVTNTGTRPGSDVVQVYAERTDVGIHRPRRTLAGFAKVHLLAGESERVTIPVDVAAFHHWDVASGAFVVENGAWQVHVSASSSEVRASHRVVTHGGAEPDCSPTCRAYRSLHPHHVFSRRAFEDLLDEDLPDNVADRPGEFTENTPLADVLHSAAGRRLHDLVAGALARDMAGDGTVFAGDARDLAREVVPRMMLQGGLTPEMVRTVVDTLNGDWRAAARDGGAVVRALAGTRTERLRRRFRRR
ncbi:glycosyl hydrolase [Nostocoides sp. F2B08]|uniref:glycoside hydrolase family 3 C-terminal domain-containing protein n=1 Tax=Nostocoides sp. F2B08 TaxID=2653936 RepID=UPI001262FFBD|nr:glycoside hydrolase family 3 C-terminal domain-containing protein [Tetrasphaera sp. F2B08]KAB7743837.1 glycosyl hydrolase [Tetrasphaera sp. F2B08]